jgi:iron complex transport system substrate-binding protein
MLGPALALALASPPSGAQVPSVVDDAGHRVAFERPARRVISLSPAITELLFTIGAGDRVVGASEYSDFPPAARALPRVARAQSVDLERIAALAPDLIVTWGSGYPAATLDALAGLGVPVFVSEPGSLESIATTLERLGRLTAAPGASAAADAFRARLQALRARYSARAPVRVFYQVWPQPLMTLSGRHVVSEAIRVCGGRNVFEDLSPLVPTIDAEAVLAADPDVLIASEPCGVDRGALAAWKRFGSMRAVARGHLETLDADKLDRATPRMLDAVEAMCERIDAARR